VPILKFWVCISPQILTKDPLSVCIRNKREILDPHPSASTLNKPASSLIRKIGHYSLKPIANYNLPVPVLPWYARFNTHHFYLFLNFIRKTIRSSQNRIRVSPCPQISSQNKICIRPHLQKILRIWIRGLTCPQSAYLW